MPSPVGRRPHGFSGIVFLFAARRAFPMVVLLDSRLLGSAALASSALLALSTFSIGKGMVAQGPDDDLAERAVAILEARCFDCHGPEIKKPKGKLRLDTRESVLKGGMSGLPALVPGEPETSLLVAAIRREEEDFSMPPDAGLPDEERLLLERWVAAGAPWPEESDAGDADARSPAAPAGTAPATPETSESGRFFDATIRPLLAANCFECHGPGLAEVESGLRMDGLPSLLRGGLRGPAVVPGDRESLLLRAVRHEGKVAMPPTGKLGLDEIAAFERWIAEGATWPGGAEGAAEEYENPYDFEAARRAWPFAPVERPPVPNVPSEPNAQGARAANPIDAFVFARLAAEGLEPGPQADEAELVRRAYFDLLGLPPAFEAIEAYRKSTDPAKWERFVDELLARPQYGERAGRAWLDVVRFAQTNGYECDGEKPYAWRFRDWVVNAFNQDLPYDQFVREQLASDELEDASADAIVATGFYHLGPWDDEPDELLQAEFDAYDDMVRTIGEGFLGLSVGCARCHDHKFDPIRQADYFGLLGFVRNVRPYTKPIFSTSSPTFISLDGAAELDADWEKRRLRHVADLESGLARMLSGLLAESGGSPGDIGDAPRTAHAESSRERLNRLLKLLTKAGEKLPKDVLLEVRATWEKIQLAATSFEGDVPWALVAREASGAPAPTHLLARGRADSPREEIEPHFLPVLCADDAQSLPALPAPSTSAASSGRRRALADWIASPDNPLTARVMANRIWQSHFGRGIVPTPNDFGASGLPPTHPELLDWLAAEFVERGWSVKAMHRLVMTSAVYRLSSRADVPAALARDPSNALLWRQNPRRLEAEAVRDALLAASGELSLESGGRGFFPEIPPAVLAGASRSGGGWEWSDEALTHRRSVYAFVKRGMLDPLLEAFDFACPDLPTGSRTSTTVVGQALSLLNGAFANARALALAQSIRAEGTTKHTDAARSVWRRALSREPSAEELELAVAFLAREQSAFAQQTPVLRFAPRVPARLDAEYLAKLPDEALLFGPKESWSRQTGIWGGRYNATLAADDAQGPSTLFEGHVFADGRLRARVELADDARHAALLLRAVEDAEGAVALGLEVRLDRERGEIRLSEHVGPGETRALAVAPFAFEDARSLDLEVELSGSRASVRIDGELVLESDALAWREQGSLGVRSAGGSLVLSDVALDFGGEALAVLPLDAPAPEECALQALCLSVFNLNEFLYVD